MKTKILMAVAAFLTAFQFFCANQAAPGGGPVDKTPPEVTVSAPANGQVNVDPRATVTVAFSEWIATAGVSGAVSLFPPLPAGVTVKAAKNRLTIIPNEPFKGNTTYHVVIGTALKDLRGNAIEAPISLVFSTGAELDSGQIAGKAISLERFTVIPRAALYWEDGNWTDAKYFGLPDYAAQCDSAGAFSFTNVKEGRYRLIAFKDQHRIRRLRMGDTCFTSLEQSVYVTKESQFIRLYPAESDTVKARLLGDTPGGVVDTLAIDTSSAAINTLHADTAAVDTLHVDDTTAVDTSKSQKPSDICLRLSGGANCLEPDEKRRWVYRPQSKKENFTVIDSAGTFSFDSIPASKGSLLWFIDDDDDGLITPGKLIPWRPPERFFIVPGVIEAKANWEITDLQVEACEE